MPTRLLIAITLICLLTTSRTLPAAAAPAGPGGALGKPCLWQGVLYTSGSIRKSAVVWQGHLLRYDLYECMNASWRYIGSSDD